jgi:uncharacterized membrane protein (DUF2068 family)
MEQVQANQAALARTLLRVIALFKLIKAAVLLGALTTVLGLLQHEPTQSLLRWAVRLHVDPDNYYLCTLLGKLLHLDYRQWFLIWVGTLLYALLFAAEGVGLWCGQVWAEYVTSVATGGLVPIELWELWQRATVTKGVLLMLNLLIVGYLVRRLHQRRAGHSRVTPRVC